MQEGVLDGLNTSPPGAQLIFALRAAATTSSNVFRPIHADLRLLYPSHGGFLICVFTCNLQTSASGVAIGLGLRINGVDAGDSLRGLYYHEAGEATVIRTASYAYPVGRLPVGMFEFTPTFNCPDSAGTVTIRAGYPCLLSVIELP